MLPQLRPKTPVLAADTWPSVTKTRRLSSLPVTAHWRQEQAGNKGLRGLSYCSGVDSTGVVKVPACLQAHHPGLPNAWQTEDLVFQIPCPLWSFICLPIWPDRGGQAHCSACPGLDAGLEKGWFSEPWTVLLPFSSWGSVAPRLFPWMLGLCDLGLLSLLG